MTVENLIKAIEEFEIQNAMALIDCVNDSDYNLLVGVDNGELFKKFSNNIISQARNRLS